MTFCGLCMNEWITTYSCTFGNLKIFSIDCSLSFLKIGLVTRMKTKVSHMIFNFIPEKQKHGFYSFKFILTNKYKYAIEVGLYHFSNVEAFSRNVTDRKISGSNLKKIKKNTLITSTGTIGILSDQKSLWSLHTKPCP